MNEFWILILVAFFVTNSLDTAESVQLEETPLEIFDEIFGEGWWDKDKDEEWHKLTLEQNAFHQIDRQNTQIGQIEPNSTDQNPPLTESDKRKIIDKFHSMRREFKQQGKYSNKEWDTIDAKIAKHLKVSRNKIYEWKKELGLSRKMFYEIEERKHLVEKFDQMKAELTQAGFKNSYPNQINETVAKELGISDKTIYKWKNELGQTAPQHKHSDSEQKELMQLYYEIKGQTPIISDENIAKRLNISRATLYKWKKHFK